tara:strand:+ start:249 stop:422 length:174 start_codon:yes stop_codon:yes gene_type:complete
MLNINIIFWEREKMWFFILFLSIVFILFAIMVAQAPVGYEDEDGFHYGSKLDQEEIN